MAWASQPSRSASNGIVPPPANGSKTFGALPRRPGAEVVRGGDQFPGRLDIFGVVRVFLVHHIFDALQDNVPGRIVHGRAVAVRREPVAFERLHTSVRKFSGHSGSSGSGINEARPPPGMPPAAEAPTRYGASKYAHAGSTSPRRLLGDFLQRQGDFNEAFQHEAVVLKVCAIPTIIGTNL